MLLARLDPRLATVVRLVGARADQLVGAARAPPPGRQRARAGRHGLLRRCASIAWLAWTIRPTRRHRGHARRVRAGGGRRRPRRRRARQRRQRVRVRGRGRGRAARGAAARVRRRRAGSAGARLGDARLRRQRARAARLHARVRRDGSRGVEPAASRSVRAEQAELLLAQTQRSHEEQLRAARLEESTRIAREIHDVLAHTLAGLTIQLEATSSLIEQGADRDTVLARVQRAHALAREGLRGDPPGGRGAARATRCRRRPESRRSSPSTARAPTRRPS